MSLLMSIYKERRLTLLESKDLNYPSLVRGCRHILGMSRTRAAEYINCEEHKLKRIELGLFTSPLDERLCGTIQALYAIPGDIYYSKYNEWLEDREKIAAWKDKQ